MIDFIMAATTTAIGGYCDLGLDLLVLAFRADHRCHLSFFGGFLPGIGAFSSEEK